MSIQQNPPHRPRKISPAIEAKIQELHEQGYARKDLAQMYGVHRSTIDLIIVPANRDRKNKQLRVTNPITNQREIAPNVLPIVRDMLQYAFNNGLTLAYLAKRMGYRRSTLTEWKNGKSQPTLFAATIMMEVLGFTLARRPTETEK